MRQYVVFISVSVAHCDLFPCAFCVFFYHEKLVLLQLLLKFCEWEFCELEMWILLPGRFAFAGYCIHTRKLQLLTCKVWNCQIVYIQPPKPPVSRLVSTNFWGETFSVFAHRHGPWKSIFCRLPLSFFSSPHFPTGVTPVVNFAWLSSAFCYV